MTWSAHGFGNDNKSFFGMQLHEKIYDTKSTFTKKYFDTFEIYFTARRKLIPEYNRPITCFKNTVNGGNTMCQYLYLVYILTKILLSFEKEYTS